MQIVDAIFREEKQYNTLNATFKECMLGYIFFDLSHLDDVYYDMYTLLNTTLQGSYGVPRTTSTSVVKSNQKIVKMYVESHINVCYFIIYYIFRFILWGWSKVQGLLKFLFLKESPNDRD